MAAHLEPISVLSDVLCVPVFCAGDIFDKWNVPPELITFAMNFLPKMYAVPGQHDMPYHDPQQLWRSAYQTMIKAGCIINLIPKKPCRVGDVIVVGYPWDTKLDKAPKKKPINQFPCYPEKPPNKGIRLPDEKCPWLSVAHHYVWNKGNGHPGAKEHDKAGRLRKRLEGFDVALFGDNHKQFFYPSTWSDYPTVVNMGSLMARTIDQQDHVPQVALMFLDGHVEQCTLTVPKPEWATTEDILHHAKFNFDAAALLQDLGRGLDTKLDFIKAINAFIHDNKVGKRTTEVLRSSMEEGS